MDFYTKSRRSPLQEGIRLCKGDGRHDCRQALVLRHPTRQHTHRAVGKALADPCRHQAFSFQCCLNSLLAHPSASHLAKLAPADAWRVRPRGHAQQPHRSWQTGRTPRGMGQRRCPRAGWWLASCSTHPSAMTVGSSLTPLMREKVEHRYPQGPGELTQIMRTQSFRMGRGRNSRPAYSSNRGCQTWLSAGLF